jgi:hypothetical protein
MMVFRYYWYHVKTKKRGWVERMFFDRAHFFDTITSWNNDEWIYYSTNTVPVRMATKEETTNMDMNTDLAKGTLN